VVEQLDGDSLIVTMEHPNQKKLKPVVVVVVVVVEIGSRGLTLIKAVTGGAATIISTPARAG
jgi:hypothetical protein